MPDEGVAGAETKETVVAGDLKRDSEPQSRNEGRYEETIADRNMGVFYSETRVAVPKGNAAKMTQDTRRFSQF
jgi:hypothetical protein